MASVDARVREARAVADDGLVEAEPARCEPNDPCVQETLSDRWDQVEAPHLFELSVDGGPYECFSIVEVAVDGARGEAHSRSDAFGRRVEVAL